MTQNNDTEHEIEENGPSVSRSRTVWKLVVVIIAVGIVVVGILVYKTSFSNQNSASVSASAVQGSDQNKADDLLQRVSHIMVLPKDEVPTTATVTDMEPLKGQPFFKDAKIGDGVIMYPGARFIVLYDPVANKIVNAGPLVTEIGEKKSSASEKLMDQ